MNYQQAKEILRDAISSSTNPDFTSRLSASPGQLSPLDTSTAGTPPEGESYADQILRAMLGVRRHIAEKTQVDSDLFGILLFLAAPIRILAAESRYSETRIPQIQLIMDAICMAAITSDIHRKSKN